MTLRRAARKAFCRRRSRYKHRHEDGTACVGPDRCATFVVLVNYMTKPKFYAVRKGLRPGIYTTWAECQEQTKGVSGAAFKSFSTQQAADQYLEGGVELLVKKRTRRQSSSLHSSQQEATPDSLGPINNEVEGASQTLAQVTQTGVPEWVEPDMLYKLVSIWAYNYTSL